MAKLILTSSVNSVAAAVAQHHEMSRNRLAFIYTAGEVEEGGLESDWMQEDRVALVEAGFEVFDYTLTGKSKSELEDDLADADVLYFSGGNTFYLLQQAQKSGFTELLTEFFENHGKVYMGTSAGSIIAGPQLPEFLLDLGEELIDPELVDAAGFHLVNFTVMPHWGSAFFKKRYLQGNLETLCHPDQHPLVFLTDHQFVVVEDGQMVIVNTIQIHQN